VAAENREKGRRGLLVDNDSRDGDKTSLRRGFKQGGASQGGREALASRSDRRARSAWRHQRTWPMVCGRTRRGRQ
jgi:hypothetical protein